MTLPSKESLDRIAALVTIVGAFVGAVWALVEFRESNRAAAVEKSLRFYEQTLARQSEVSAALTAVVREIGKTRDETLAAARANARNPEGWTAYVIAKVNKSEEFRFNLLHVVGYFDALYYCVDSDACHEPTAVGLFGETAVWLRGNFFPWIYCQRSVEGSGKKFGQGVDYLAIESVAGSESFFTARETRAEMRKDRVECPAGWRELGRPPPKT